MENIQLMLAFGDFWCVLYLLCVHLFASIGMSCDQRLLAEAFDMPDLARLTYLACFVVLLLASLHAVSMLHAGFTRQLVLLLFILSSV